jgi:hypothetical protein
MTHGSRRASTTAFRQIGQRKVGGEAKTTEAGRAAVLCGNLGSGILFCARASVSSSGTRASTRRRGHRLRDSKVGSGGHFVEIELTGECSDRELGHDRAHRPGGGHAARHGPSRPRGPAERRACEGRHDDPPGLLAERRSPWAVLSRRAASSPANVNGSAVPHRSTCPEASCFGDCPGFRRPSEPSAHGELQQPGAFHACPHVHPNRLRLRGSNLAAATARARPSGARQHRGAIYGRGVGPQGKAYDAPDKDRHLRVLPLEVIQGHVADFLDYTRRRPTLRFEVTTSAAILAGYRTDHIAPMFSLDAAKRHPAGTPCAPCWPLASEGGASWNDRRPPTGHNGGPPLDESAARIGRAAAATAAIGRRRPRKPRTRLRVLPARPVAPPTLKRPTGT